MKMKLRQANKIISSKGRHTREQKLAAFRRLTRHRLNGGWKLFTWRVSVPGQ